MSRRAVKLTADVLHLVGVREYGMPTGMYVGATWRSQERGTVSCILPGPGDRVMLDTRPLVVLDKDALDLWWPVAWDRAWAAYAMQWPDSALLQAYLTRSLSPEQRAAHLHQLTRWIAAKIDARDFCHAHALAEVLQLWCGSEVGYA